MDLSMDELDMEVALKVIVVGNGMVGKTSLITRFATGRMTEQYKKTIGTDFMERDVQLSSGDSMKLMLWDTAGQEMFSTLTRAYYKGAGAVIFVFSTTDRESFLEVERWVQKVHNEVGPICSVLVQNKCDQLAQAQMTAHEVEDLARRLGLKLYRACVKDNTLVDDVFTYLCQSYLRAGGALASEEAVTNIGELQAKDATSAALEILESVPHKQQQYADPSIEQTLNSATTNDPSDTRSDHSTHSNESADSNAGAAPSSQQQSQTSHRPLKSAAVSKGFQLQPLTRRTNGKKSSAVAQHCTIL